MPERSPVNCGSTAYGRFGAGAAADAVPAEILRQVFARLEPIALGGSLAIVAGILVFAATNLLILKGGDRVGTHLALLANYWPGYHVTVMGSIVGALYGSVCGFLFGWLTAQLRNLFLHVRLRTVRLWANLSRTYFLDRFD